MPSPTPENWNPSLAKCGLSAWKFCSNPPPELEEIYAPQDGCLDSLGVKSPSRFLVNPLEELYQKTGLGGGRAGADSGCTHGKI